MKPAKLEELHQRMERLGIKEEEVEEKFILGSGKGGQKINKTSSCVYLKHLPTGFEVKCQKSRSREMNRFLARRKLCDLVEDRQEGVRSQRQQKIEKLRRQKRKRTKRSQEKVLRLKKERSEVKKNRQAPD